jgi:hypothetical protein
MFLRRRFSGSSGQPTKMARPRRLRTDSFRRLPNSGMGSGDYRNFTTGELEQPLRHLGHARKPLKKRCDRCSGPRQPDTK